MCKLRSIKIYNVNVISRLEQNYCMILKNIGVENVYCDISSVEYL